MIESGRNPKEFDEKVNCESLKSYAVPYQRDFYEAEPVEHLFQVHSFKNSASTKQNEHDMLQASQADLKRSSNYTNNIKQVINLNSSIQERYHKLQSLSLHHILNKGNFRSNNMS